MNPEHHTAVKGRTHAQFPPKLPIINTTISYKFMKCSALDHSCLSLLQCLVEFSNKVFESVSGFNSVFPLTAGYVTLWNECSDRNLAFSKYLAIYTGMMVKAI